MRQEREKFKLILNFKLLNKIPTANTRYRNLFGLWKKNWVCIWEDLLSKSKENRLNLVPNHL
jgi:hypothetical protein